MEQIVFPKPGTLGFCCFLAFIAALTMTANAAGIFRSAKLPEPFLSEIVLLLSRGDKKCRLLAMIGTALVFSVLLATVIVRSQSPDRMIFRIVATLATLDLLWFLLFIRSGIQYQGGRSVLLSVATNLSLIAVMTGVVTLSHPVKSANIVAVAAIITLWVFGFAFPWLGETP